MEESSKSMAEQLSALPVTEQQKFFKSLSEKEAQELMYDWDFWARPNQKIPDGDWDFWLCLAGRGWGKGLPLDTKIPTPEGWTTMGELKVGDKVIDECGIPTSVTFKTDTYIPNKAYKFTFSDGSTVISCDEHQWVTWSHLERKSDSKGPKIRTTQEIVDSFYYGKREELNHSIPLAKPITFEEKEFKIPPYTLGAELRDLGVRNYKHIPKEYLRGSINQRLSLLQGIMDTDGWVEDENYVSIVQKRKGLMDGIYELVVSLGMKAVRYTKEARGYGEYGPYYGLRFRATMPAFKLARKLNKLDNSVRHHHRMIVGYEQVEVIPMQCITVDSPNSMYLAGEQMIPTHNTRVGAETIKRKIEESEEPLRIALVAPTAKDARDTMVLGESGLVNIYPEDNRPIYKPSKARVEFPGGSVGFLYSSEKPERLRGPQHHIAWADEACLVKDTMITVKGGDKSIQDIKVGDLVLTRFGYKPVINCGLTRKDTDILTLTTTNGKTIQGTGNHPVYIKGKGFIPLQDVDYNEVLIIDNSYTGGVKCDKLFGRLFGMDKNGAGVKVSTTKVVSVEKEEHVADVYNLEVAEQPEYFANGLLVHNCAWGGNNPEVAQMTWDMLQMGMRLGEHPVTIVTTTPKPFPLIVELIEDKGCHVTKGSTFDNAANLADNFMKTILSKYEGTRLGRQELYAEVLLDAPDALWDIEMLEKLRINPKDEEDLPSFERIVVAIDPAVTSNANSDLTGIVVVAKGTDGHGYVLEDLSTTAKPEVWANIAIQAYRKWEADVIVAEVNNGGDLVESVIRVHDDYVSYKSVRASRGKVVRAEPVAALYEQERIHHVGVFDELEDEMCKWSPAHSSKSPDRMDALVWAATELFVNERVSSIVNMTKNKVARV